MDGINKATIFGNLGADPELRMLPGGNAVLKMRVATNESWLDKEKNRQERTEWHRVTVFGRRAEALAKFVRKGMKVFIEGRNQTTSYDKDGQKHYSTEIIAELVHVMGSARGSDAAHAADADAPFAPQPVTNGAASRGAPAASATDIPF